jgi:transforming growth factor-beta-induced protein
MRRLLFLLLIAALLIIPLLAQEPTVGQRLVDAATAPDEPQFQVLLAAALESDVLRSILDDPDADITVFAPTDEAFFAALDELGIGYSELTTDTSQLIAILTYHIVEGRVPAADLTDQSVLNTLYGETTLTVTTSTTGLLLNDTAQILESDITASNGLIHVIDTVLLPPADSGTSIDSTPETETLADIVGSRDDLSTVWAALEAAGFTNALAQNDQTMTLFLPNNEALEAAGLSVSDLGISAIAYHAVEGQYLLDDLVDFGNLPSQQGEEIVITVTDTGIALNGEAAIVEADIVASNGVIHIIDRPLAVPGMIPPTESTEESGN